MQRRRERNPRQGRAWRTAARFWGTLTAGYWFIMILGHLLAEPPSKIADEGFVLSMLIMIIVILSLLAWRWEKESGALLLLCGVALSLFALNTAGSNHILAMLVSGAPFILSGFLFIASAWMNEMEEMNE